MLGLMIRSVMCICMIFVLFSCGSDENGSGSTENGDDSFSFTMPENPGFHRAILHDFNGDGLLDIVTAVEHFKTQGDTVEKSNCLIWFKGDSSSASGFEDTYTVIGPDIDSMFSLYDLDGDNDMDIVGASFFKKNDKTFGWYERKGDATDPQWEYHNISSSLGDGFQLEIVEDLYSGTEGLYAIGTNHMNNLLHPESPDAGVFIFNVPDDPTSSWNEPVTISSGLTPVDAESAGCLTPGTFSYGDLDHDGSIDIVVSGDGDRRVFYYEQTSSGVFTQHVLEADAAQTGLMQIADLDGDGWLDMVMPVYENNVVWLYIGKEASAADASSTGNYYYKRVTLEDATTSGPAFITLDYINGDNKLDIIASYYGYNELSGDYVNTDRYYMSGVTVFIQGDDIETWEKVIVQPQNGSVTFATRTDTGDIDGDGDTDILLPTGFFPCAIYGKSPCGGMLWYENTDASTGSQWIKHTVWTAADN